MTPGNWKSPGDAHTQTTKTLLNYRVAWTPQGESFKSADQTDWNTHTTGTQHIVTGLDAGASYKVKIRTRYEGNQGSRWTDVVTGQAAAPAAPTVPTNSAAAGLPAITGTAEVGETLTAATSAISDGNGLTNAVFTYQWIRSASGTDTDISGVTSSTYVITNADVDAAIKIRVSFTDDDGYSETLTSNATASVPVPAPAIIPPEEPQIAQAAGDTPVPDDWNLIPSGKGLGDRFRLIFLSSTKHNATSSSISNYNTFIQNRAAAGDSALDDYSSLFKVVGCTNAVDARDNTGTTGTGVPIYWLNGNKVADNYADFYDETWDNEANDKNESGTNGPDTSDSDNYPATGCDHDGTKVSSRELGSGGSVRVGRAQLLGLGQRPHRQHPQLQRRIPRPMYGLSPVFIVVEFSDDAKLSALAIEGATTAKASASVRASLPIEATTQQPSLTTLTWSH